MQSTILLSNCSGKIDFIGEPVKALGYESHNTNKRTHTLGIYTTNFVGRFWLQGSLKDEPKDKLDWFIIPLSEETPYIEFNNYKDDMTVNRENKFINVNGSFVWLRGILDRRSYIKIQDCPVKPFNTHSSNVITSGSAVAPHYTNELYPESNVNPIYDPEYYPEWIPNYKSAHSRSCVSSKLGNIEKVILCY
jgi:hypothetical protein